MKRWRTCEFSFRQGCEVITGRVDLGFDRHGRAFSLIEGDLNTRQAEAWERAGEGGGCHPIDFAAPPRSCGCQKAKVYRWLGVRWWGKPWPLRWHWRWPELLYVEADGCGCVLRLKALWDACGHALRA